MYQKVFFNQYRLVEFIFTKLIQYTFAVLETHQPTYISY